MSSFFETYTRGLTADELQQVFTRDTREAYRFFTRGVDTSALAKLPWHQRLPAQARLLFLAYTLKLSPARRVLYGFAVLAAIAGGLSVTRGFESIDIVGPFMQIGVPLPSWSAGAFWLATAFLLVNLILWLELADRLSLKDDLEIAREIQLAMLPQGTVNVVGLDVRGRTRPANTVGGDFYDVISLPDGRVVIAVGDVAGKGSPASLLMALLLAMLRTLVDEHCEPVGLTKRLNVQIRRHAPPSRFITLFLSVYEPVSGRLSYVNAGHTPPLLRRVSGRVEKLLTGGVALGMFGGSEYRAEQTVLEPGDVLALYSDGVTEAENESGEPFEEAGLEAALAAHPGAGADEIGAAVLDAVDRHARGTRLADDLTILVVRRTETVARSREDVAVTAASASSPR